MIATRTATRPLPVPPPIPPSAVVAPMHQMAHEPSLLSSKGCKSLTSILFIFEFFVIIVVIIYVYMIKMISNMQFLLCLVIMKVVGLSLNLIKGG